MRTIHRNQKVLVFHLYRICAFLALRTYHNFFLDFYQNSYNFITYCHNFIEFKYENNNQKNRDLLIANEWSAADSPDQRFLWPIKVLGE